MKASKILPAGLALLLAGLAFAASGMGWEQDQQQKLAPQYRRPQTKIEAVPISGGLYELRGGVSNAAFYVGEEGVVLVDAKMTPEEAAQMLSAIAGVTDKPLTTILLTHSDGDHVGGLTGFPREATIIAQERTARHMEAAFTTDEQKAFLPDITFSESLSLRDGDKEIRLKYFGRAHTDGDAAAFFPGEKVVVCGDLIFLGRDPLIHRTKNGSALGLITVLKKILALEAELFLHGHGSPISREELETLVRSLEEKAARVEALFHEGKSLEEVKKALGEETGGEQRRWPSYAENLYLELADRKK